jgi:hypothetical protein
MKRSVMISPNPLRNSKSQADSAIAAPLHTVALLVLLAGYAIWGKIRADQLRAANNPEHLKLYLMIGLSEWILFGFTLWGSSARVLLGPRWKSLRQVLLDIGIAAGFWISSAIVLAILGRILGVTPFAREAEFLLPRGPAELAAWVAISVSAGICEEAIFRGYLQRQFISWTRRAPIGILLSAALFGAGHIYQGYRSAVLIAAYGSMFGILAYWRKTVRPGMMAHAWQDSLSGLVAGVIQRSLR